LLGCELLAIHLLLQGATGFAGAGITLEAKVERPVMQA